MANSVGANSMGGERLHALDAVRGGALMLGVLFHACLPFLLGPQLWIVRDDASTELTVAFYVLHVFRMTVFFLLAGFFARMLLERRGVGGFIKNRLARIATPLAMFWPIVFTVIVAVLIWVSVRANGGEAPSGEPPPSPLTVEAWPLTHLWFLYVLLIFYAVALALRGLVVLVDRSGALRARIVDPVVKFIAGPAAVMFLALPVFAALYFAPSWMAYFGIPTPDTGLVPNPTALICYGVAFGFGWLVNRQVSILESWAKHWLSNLSLGVFCTVVCLMMLGVEPVLAPAERGFDTMLYAALYALGVWGWTLGIIGGAVRLLKRESEAVRYVADASYWIYIVHIPVLLVMQALVQPLDLPWSARYPMTVGISFAIMFVSYDLLVRYSWLGAILNGRKVRPGKAKREPQLAAAE
ncbi:acyltransferase family protein [Terricaulis silvestris]|uniref:Glucans biosynthesis protein C n=1 Tax=Terricaulis silvestris TaxID=2686094 RepID=A0A6I6MSB0_9CAUL|nr:acyltransferase family protein [Terricaulis silvestris]QGZ96316.1 Glucans biosynthesis protein C [Terricaulis silvestris]